MTGKLVSNSEDCRVNKKTWGTSECPNYSQHPDHSAYFINYYSNEGDTVVDVMSGRGTNLLVAAALGRKVVGYDLSPQNLEAVRSACLQHTEIEPTDLVLHHSDGVALNEYDGQEEIWDLVTFDPPYIFPVTITSLINLLRLVRHCSILVLNVSKSLIRQRSLGSCDS